MFSEQIDQSILKEIYDKAISVSDFGKVATYIPELSLMSPNLFSLSCVIAGSGEIIQTGDADTYFTMNSYILQGIVGSISMGVIISAIVALLVKSKVQIPD